MEKDEFENDNSRGGGGSTKGLIFEKYVVK
jgi:hypothetical protein